MCFYVIWMIALQRLVTMNKNILKVLTDISKSQTPLNLLYQLGKEYGERLPLLTKSLEEDSIPVAFFANLLLFSDKTLQCNAERVIYKEKVFSDFKVGLAALINGFISDPSAERARETKELFEKCFFNNSFRKSLSERTITHPIDGSESGKYFVILPQEDEKTIDPYGRDQDWEVNFDLWLSHKPTKECLCDKYTAQLLDIKRKHGLDGVVFVDKYSGPEGLSGLIREGYAKKIKESLGLVSISFNQRTKRIKPIGSSRLPKVGANLALLFDVVRSGESLNAAAKRLNNTPYKWTIIESVALLDFSPKDKPQETRITSILDPIDIDSIAKVSSLSDRWSKVEGSLKEEIEKIDDLYRIDNKMGVRRELPVFDSIIRQLRDVIWWDEESPKLLPYIQEDWVAVANEVCYKASNEEELEEIAKRNDLTFSYIANVQHSI